MSDLIILVSSNASQTGVVITDETDWGSIGGSRNSLNSVIVNLYGTSLVTPSSSYALTELELDTFITTGSVEVSFLNLAGVLYIADGWWSLNITANSLAYVSNYAGFGIYASITFAVFSQINSLHVPEEVKYTAEKYCIYAMWLEGLKFLDTTNINSRGVKFAKRLLSLQKMLAAV